MPSRNPNNKPLDPDRLFEASMAVMRALAAMPHRPGVWPPDMLESPDAPETLRGFTRHEIEDASVFLARLGYLQRPKTRYT